MDTEANKQVPAMPIWTQRRTNTITLYRKATTFETRRSDSSLTADASGGIALVYAYVAENHLSAANQSPPRPTRSV
jgi:hypothetical protein